MASPTSSSKAPEKTNQTPLTSSSSSTATNITELSTTTISPAVTFPDNSTTVTLAGSSDNSGDEDNKPAIIGAAVAAFVVTCLLVFLIFLFIYKRRKRRKKSPPAMLPHPNGTPYMTYHSRTEHTFDNVAAEVESEHSAPEDRTVTEPEHDANAELHTEADVNNDVDISPGYVMPLPTMVPQGYLDHEYMTASSLETTSSWATAAPASACDAPPAASGIDPNRMDSQKYLIPVPSPKPWSASESSQAHGGFLPNHHSEPDLSVNLKKGRPPHFKWMASPPVIHKSESDTTENENVYFSMDVNTPSCRISVTPRSPVDPETPPTPIFGTKARDYVNVGNKRQESPLSASSVTPSEKKNHVNVDRGEGEGHDATYQNVDVSKKEAEGKGEEVKEVKEEKELERIYGNVQTLSSDNSLVETQTEEEMDSDLNSSMYINVGPKKTEPKPSKDSPKTTSSKEQDPQKEEEPPGALYMNVAEVEKKAKDITVSETKQMVSEVSSPVNSTDKPPVKAKPPKPLPKPTKQGYTGLNSSSILHKGASVQGKNKQQENEYKILAGVANNVEASAGAESRETLAGAEPNKSKIETALKKPDLKKLSSATPLSCAQQQKEPFLIKEKHILLSHDTEKDNVVLDRNGIEASSGSGVGDYDTSHDDWEVPAALYTNVPRRKDHDRSKGAFRKISAPCGPLTNDKDQRAKTASTGEVNKIGAVDINELKKALKSHVKK